MAKYDNYFSKITASCRLGSHLTNGYNFPLASGSLLIPAKFASTEWFGATTPQARFRIQARPGLPSGLQGYGLEAGIVAYVSESPTGCGYQFVFTLCGVEARRA